ncbi:MAG: Hpt domain-containing protein [Verrucomicrobia bacterium]|nr:Hpt domain-containing protein [Verrucomicrobiota bacterium]
MLLNLAVNARDAMPAGGTLTFGAENIHFDDTYCTVNSEARPGPHVVLRVSDNGTGIPAKIREKIFDPFFTTKKPGACTGLGLATVANIVRSHSGFIRIESEVGCGTTFRIFLPARADAKINEPPERSPEHGVQSVLNRATIERIRCLTRSSGVDLMPQLVESYIQESTGRLVAVQEAIATGDAVALRLQAHTLKGSSLSVGAQSFARVCQEIERLAMSDATQSAALLLGEAHAEFARVRDELMREIADGARLQAGREHGAGV